MYICHQAQSSLHNEDRTKWLLLCRRHFQIYFKVKKQLKLCSDSHVTEISLRVLNQQNIAIGINSRVYWLRNGYNNNPFLLSNKKFLIGILIAAFQTEAALEKFSMDLNMDISMEKEPSSF